MDPLPCSALLFVDAAVRQLAWPPGAATPSSAEERAWRERVLAVLRLATERSPNEGPEAAAQVLGADARLLAVVFSNVDLLYAHADPAADAVGAAVMRALELVKSGPDPPA